MHFLIKIPFGIFLTTNLEKDDRAADEVIKAIGIETEIGQKWSFKIQLSSDPTEKKPTYGWFVSIEVSNAWAD